jgi:hypothetical protein
MKRGISISQGAPSTVIPAPAGIQVRFPAELAWIPAFSDMMKTQESLHSTGANIATFTGLRNSHFQTMGTSNRNSLAIFDRMFVLALASDFEFPRWVIGER